MHCASASPPLLFMHTSDPLPLRSSIASHHPLPMSPTSPRQPGAGGAARNHHHHQAACKVHRDSHGIHKASATSPPSSSSTNSSVSSSSTTSRPAPPPAPAARQKHQQQPVIIYTHSPKVIRTSPRDFMSIVQKLTGLDGPARAAAAARSSSAAAAAQDESSSSSSESCANAHAVHAAAAAPHPYADPRLMPPPAAPQMDAHFAAPDIPLFQPGPSELQLCMPTGLYDPFPLIDAAPLGPVMNGNGGAAFSPSMVEAMRTFPDY